MATNPYKIKLVKSAFLPEGETKKKLAEFVLQAPTFSMGPECRKFEEAFAAKQGRKYAVFLNSGSSANLVLIQSLLNLGRLTKGDKVGVSAVTWSTNVMPLLQLGLQPVAIDCEKDTLNVSPATLAPFLGEIKALFITNVLGFCDDLATIAAQCKEKGVILLEDNCEGLGSRAYGTLLGNFGVASTFSFFLGHHLSTLEGGIVATDDEELYEMSLMARSHGWSRQLPEAKRAALREAADVDPFYELYTFYDLGYNLRPTELNGFLGNTQIGYWDEVVKARDANFRAFLPLLDDHPDISPLRTSHLELISNFAVPLLFRTKDAYLAYRTKFQEASVEIRPIIAGDITSQPFYKKYVQGASPCANAQFVHDQGFYFGNNSELTEEELETLAGLIRS